MKSFEKYIAHHIDGVEIVGLYQPKADQLDLVKANSPENLKDYMQKYLLNE